jgi:ferredoxin-type protein NapG
LSDGGMSDRRGFFLQNFKALGRLLGDAVGQALVSASGGGRHLRPPGALDEAAFLLSCTRCGDCADACPTKVIKFLAPSAGLAAGTPYIDPTDKACNLCGECMPVCKPGALLQITDPRLVRMGTAVINTTTCWSHQGSVCDLCYQRCPFPDEAIRTINGKPEIMADGCTGCGMCAAVCVSTPISIHIEPRK